MKLMGEGRRWLNMLSRPARRVEQGLPPLGRESMAPGAGRQRRCQQTRAERGVELDLRCTVLMPIMTRACNTQPPGIVGTATNSVSKRVGKTRVRDSATCGCVHHNSDLPVIGVLPLNTGSMGQRPTTRNKPTLNTAQSR